MNKQKFSLISSFGFLALLAFVVLLSHYMLIDVGLALHNSEWSAFLLAADWFRKGDLSAFAFQCNYGGLTLTALRALFTWLWDSLFSLGSPVSALVHVNGHMFFSYIICTVLLCYSGFYLVRSYCSKQAAWMVSLLCAFGFQSWVYIQGNEFYPMYLMLAFILFGLRARTANPFLELDLKRLFLCSLICGQLIYATKATLIFVVAFFLCWDWLWEQIKEIYSILFPAANSFKRTPNSLLQKVIAWFGIVFAGLGLYIEVFGRNLGEIAGKAIKLDAKPNTKIGCLLIAIAWLLRKNWLALKFKDSNFRTRVILICVGFFLGYLPELLHWLPKGRLTSDQIVMSQEFKESFRLLGLLPASLKSLLTGDQPYRVFNVRDFGIGQNACIILFVLSCIAFFYSLRKEKNLQALAFVVLLTVFAFCRVRTTYQETAPSRYLFPLFPFYLVALGKLVDFSLTKRKVILACILALFAFSSAHQIGARIRTVDALRKTGFVENLYATVAEFQKHPVQIVISDDFWYSNNLSLIVEGTLKKTPGFWATWRDWGPFEYEEMAKTKKLAGVLLEAKDHQNRLQLKKVSLLGRDWSLKPIAQFGDRDLYIGRTP